MRLCAAAPDDDGPCQLPGDRAGSGAAQTWRARQDEPSRCTQRALTRAGSMWRYEDVMPTTTPVTLGEGMTRCCTRAALESTSALTESTRETGDAKATRPQMFLAWHQFTSDPTRSLH
jgi:hypothetical protein